MTRKPLFFLLALWVISMPADAGGIYRWVDDNGQVHYGDRPTGGDVEKIKGAAPGDPATVKRLQQQQEYLQNHEEQQAEHREEAAKARQEETEQAAKCTEAKRHLTRLQQARFIYETTENGERRILSDSERKASEARAQEQVRALCS